MRTSLSALVWLALSLGSLPLAQSPRSSTVLGGGPVVPPIAQGVGIDANAGFVAVAFADALGVVYLVSSTDAGQSWSAPLPLSSLPGPKVLSTNSVQLIGYEAYVCWVVNVGGGNEELWYARVDVAGSLPGIVTPETKVPHGAPPGQIRDFDMEVSFGGTMRWLNFAQSVDPGPADVNEQLWVSSSIDGVSFGSTPVTTAFAPGSADVDAIDVDASGPRVVVAWSDDSSGTNDVYVSINHAGGMGPWSPSQIHVDVSPAPAQQGEGLSVDTSAMLTFVVWNEAPSPGGSQRTFGAALDTVGGALSAPMLLNPLGDADDCAAVVTQDGDVVALSRDDRSGVNEIWARRSHDLGASYGLPAKLSTDGASSLDVDAGGKGVIAAVWTAGPHPEGVESAYSCDGGQSWTTLGLSSTTGDADSAAVGFDPFEKQVLGAWLSDDLGSNRAYSAGYGACLPPPPPCFQAANFGPAVSQPTLIVPGTAAQRSTAGDAPEGAANPVVRLYHGLDYTPEETRVNGLRPLPAQRLTVFYPTGQPKPADGWPVLLFSPAGAFREGQAASDSEEAALPYPLGTKSLDFNETQPLLEICAASADGSEDAALGGFLYDALASGWAVVSVGSVGIDSRLDNLGKLVPFGGLLLNDRDPNIFYPPEDGGGSPTPEWENFELFWGEKDFTWARQYVAEHAGELELDDDVVVTSGVSSGAIYAAFVALGPDRAHASGSSQVMQSTQCAGFLGFEVPAWFPAFNHEVPAPHWEGANPGYRAATIAQASTSDLAASSVSTWIRATGSFAASTPALIVYDEGVAADDAADFERDDGNGGCDSWPTATGDPCLTDALLPCVDCHDLDSVCALLGFPDGCFCNPFVSRYCEGSDVEIIDFTRAHDSWNGIVLLQDLLTYGDPDSQLLMETGVLTDYPDLPALQTAIYTDTSGTFPASAADDPFARRYALSWLCQLRDDVKGTSSDCPVAVYRNESPNPASLSLTPPILGKTMTCVVDLDTTGHPMVQVIGLDTPASIPLATYVLLCQDSGSGILFQSTASGPIAVVDIAIPNGTYMAGSTFCVQAIHFGGGSGDALSNAQDVVVGL